MSADDAALPPGRVRATTSGAYRRGQTGAYQAGDPRPLPGLRELAEEALYNIAWCLLNEAPAEPSAQHRGRGCSRRCLESYLTALSAGRPRWASTARYTLAEMSYNAGDYDAGLRACSSGDPGRVPRNPRRQPARPKASCRICREAVAYREYEARPWRTFNRAVDGESDDGNLIRQAIGRSRGDPCGGSIPMTSSGLGARKMNAGGGLSSS